MRKTMASLSRPRGPARRAILPVLVLACLAAAALSPPVAAGAADLTLSDGYIRMIIPARPAAGYFTLANNGDSGGEPGRRVLTGMRLGDAAPEQVRSTARKPWCR